MSASSRSLHIALTHSLTPDPPSNPNTHAIAHAIALSLSFSLASQATSLALYEFPLLNSSISDDDSRLAAC